MVLGFRCILQITSKLFWEILKENFLKFYFYLIIRLLQKIWINFSLIGKINKTLADLASIAKSCSCLHNAFEFNLVGELHIKRKYRGKEHISITRLELGERTKAITVN